MVLSLFGLFVKFVGGYLVRVVLRNMVLKVVLIFIGGVSVVLLDFYHCLVESFFKLVELVIGDPLILVPPR